MNKPIVAIVGRPNVGKSTFFNKISGQRLAIVDDTPGVTRDRIYADAEWNGRAVTLVDTGGIEPVTDSELLKQMRIQAQLAIDSADVIIFLTDVSTGVTADDKDVSTMLRKSGKPVLVAVNKCDKGVPPPDFYEFYSLGFEDVFPVSSLHGTGTGDLLDRVVELLPPENGNPDEEDYIRVAVIGKPNAGKSRLTNALLGYDRTIVSDIAGTTRDAIDTPLEVDGKKYTLIDTAGIRRKRSVNEDLEYYSVLRSFAAIRRADVCLIVIDASEGLTEQDVKIAGYVHEQGKPSVIVMNKWDKVEKDTHTINEFENKLKCDLAFMDYYKSVYISAQNGHRTNKLFGMCE